MPALSSHRVERALSPASKNGYGFLLRRETLSTAREPSLIAMRRRIADHVSGHIDDPELSIDAIAASIGCSRRYLHKAFDSGAETLSEMIWRLRLERCARNLRDSAMANRSITEIAFASGFNSSQHFSRVFRARYGMTARDWRKRRDPVEPIPRRSTDQQYQPINM